MGMTMNLTKKPHAKPAFTMKGCWNLQKIRRGHSHFAMKYEIKLKMSMSHDSSKQADVNLKSYFRSMDQIRQTLLNQTNTFKLKLSQNL